MPGQCGFSPNPKNACCCAPPAPPTQGHCNKQGNGGHSRPQHASQKHHTPAGHHGQPRHSNNAHGQKRMANNTHPQNRIPLRCGAEPGKFCGCTAPHDEAVFKKRLPTGTTFCSDGCCETACAASRRPARGAPCLGQQQKWHHPTFDRNKDLSNSKGHGDDKNHCKDKKHKNNCCSDDDDSDEECCCCEHGVKFPECHRPRCPTPPPPIIVEKEKPILVVNNTELCACESKWRLIERWQAAAKRREAERRCEEEAYHRERAKERYKKRMEAAVRHRECLMMQKELEKRRRAEEDDWRRRRIDMEDKRLAQEYEMWLEDLLEDEASRRAQEATERRQEARLWREEQTRPRSRENLTLPELEELRRVLAPVDQGPNEVFEYFVVDPCKPAKPTNPEEVAKALMNMKCSDGIHIRVGDRQQKRATLRVNMGPCCDPGNNKNITIDGGSTNCCCPSPEQEPLIPPEVIQLMLKIKEANNPCLRFNQTNPPWTKMEGTINLPNNGVAPILAPYYCCPSPVPAPPPCCYYPPPPC